MAYGSRSREGQICISPKALFGRRAASQGVTLLPALWPTGWTYLSQHHKGFHPSSFPIFEVDLKIADSRGIETRIVTTAPEKKREALHKTVRHSATA